LEKIIISDTDFLSAFLKIDRLDIIFQSLETNEIIIPKTVSQELEALENNSVHDKFLQFLNADKNKLVILESEKCVSSQRFGKGELECISLAEKGNTLLLMDDRAAGRFAKSKGITVMEIPAFLLYCKTINMLSNLEITQIIRDLKEKDYYEFAKEIEEKLLE
jgi:predicted nucleic acid-binding protein